MYFARLLVKVVTGLAREFAALDLPPAHANHDSAGGSFAIKSYEENELSAIYAKDGFEALKHQGCDFCAVGFSLAGPVKF